MKLRDELEMSEVDVLRGLKNVLTESCVEAIILEGDPNFLTRRNSELYNILTSAGFTIKQLIRNEKTHHHLDNFLAVRH